jgi:hypothetical protein
MRTEFVWKDLRIYILSNDEEARKFAADALMKSAIAVGRNAILIAYHLQDNLMLLHVEKFTGKKDIFEAMRFLKTKLLFGDIHTQDEELRRRLNEPTFSTRKILLEFLESEMNPN